MIDSALVEQLIGHPNVGITLSGGGARGAAHIGVLQALAEANIRPSRVVGVSAGAIVGALYAAGKTPKEMLDFVAASSVIKFIKLGVPRTGLTTLDYLKSRLSEVLQVETFADLEIPFYVGATNLNTGELALVGEGNLYDWVAASCSLPFVFKPMEIDEQLYVDGGAMCNLPVAPLQGQVDFIIGSNLIPTQPVASSELSSVIGISWRCVDLVVMAASAPNRAACDWLIEPDGVAAHNIFAFNKIKDIYQLGYDFTKKQLLSAGVEMNKEEAAKI